MALLGRMLRLISERPLNSIVTPRRNTPPGTVGVIVVGRGTKLSRNVAPDRLLAEAGGKLISGGKSVAVALGSPQLCQLQPSMVPGRRTIAGAAGAILAINQAPGMGGSSRVTGGCAEFPDHGGEGGMREHTWLHNSAHGDDPLWQNSSFARNRAPALAAMAGARASKPASRSASKSASKSSVTKTIVKPEAKKPAAKKAATARKKAAAEKPAAKKTVAASPGQKKKATKPPLKPPSSGKKMLYAPESGSDVDIAARVKAAIAILNDKPGSALKTQAAVVVLEGVLKVML